MIDKQTDGKVPSVLFLRGEGCRKEINDHEFDERWNKITDRKV